MRLIAHRAALAVGGKTTAVLAHGLDMMYPAVHKSKALKMLESGGWVSEYFTGTKPEPPFFPARNRIISGICQGVLVVEAGEKGGALITARTAFEQNRQVYAIPGRLSDPYSQGCHRLIAEDIARLVTRPQQILDDLEIDWQHHDDLTEQLNLFLPAPEILLTAEEAKILNFLAQGEAVVDQIGQATGIPMARLQSLLLSMEFKSLVRQLPGKKFLKI
ncbi:MAG: DNA-processing protein DprA [Bacteroidota bacterium]